MNTARALPPSPISADVAARSRSVLLDPQVTAHLPELDRARAIRAAWTILQIDRTARAPARPAPTAQASVLTVPRAVFQIGPKALRRAQSRTQFPPNFPGDAA